MFEFLTLPERTNKPRESGLTHVLDKGLSLDQVRQFLEVAGDYVGIVKLGWGTAVVTPNVKEKIALYQSSGIPVCFGGTFFEVCLRQGKLAEFLALVDECGMECVEISDGTIAMDEEDKLAIVRKLSKRYTVLSEVGNKDEAVVITPSTWLDSIKRELDAGAWKVITEGRENGTVGIYRPSGDIKDGLLEEILNHVRHLPAPLRGAAQEAAGLVHHAVRRQREPRQHPAGRGHLGGDDARGRARRHAARVPLTPRRYARLAGPDLTMTLLLVRHCQTDWNREPARCQGWAEVELNEVGRAQARDLGRALAGRGVELVVTSHLVRARETAELVHAELGGELPSIVDPRLAETHRGEWETRRFSSIMREEPDVWRHYREHPETFRFPGGESLGSQQRRVLACLRDCALDWARGAPGDTRRRHPPRPLLPRGSRYRRVPHHKDGQRRRRRDRDGRPRRAHRRLPGREGLSGGEPGKGRASTALEHSLVDVERQAGVALPAEAEGGRAAGRADRGRPVRIVEHLGDHPRDGLRVVRRDQPAAAHAVVDEVLRASPLDGEHGCALGHGLRVDEPEGLVPARHGEELRSRHQRQHAGVLHPADEVDVVGHALGRGSRLEACRSGPSPTIASWTRRPARRSLPTAAMRSAVPLRAISWPTVSTSGSPGR